MSWCDIYFVDAATGDCPPYSGFPNFNLAKRQLYNLPKELVLSHDGDICSSTWVIEKEKLPQVMEHIYPRGAEHYDHSGGKPWVWKAITDAMNGPTVIIRCWED